MKTVTEAQSLVLQYCQRLSSCEVAAAEALGLVLAEDVISDVDSPPHDKSVVDGFAVRTADFVEGKGRLEVIEIITAGSVPTKALSAGQTSQIMTGAPLPTGADAIVIVERSNLARGELAKLADLIELHEPKLKPGQNIMRRGIAMQQGEQVLASGTRLRAVELGILAEVGRTKIAVQRRPVVAVLATGDELVPPHCKPAAGKIRNSNGPLLVGMVREADAAPYDLGIALDTADSLREKIVTALANCDLLLLSGGVSAGVLDLVPTVLAELGVVEVFHQVSLKPGKPLWFGVYENDARRCLVFGLPGNPVSTFVSFTLFVRPVLDRLLGRPTLQPIIARLSKAHVCRGDRSTYWPSRLIGDEADATRQVEPLNWHGSGDLRTLLNANALAIFETAGEHPAGEEVPILRL